MQDFDNFILNTLIRNIKNIEEGTDEQTIGTIGVSVYNVHLAVQDIIKTKNSNILGGSRNKQKVHIGPHGGKYVIRNGKKVYAK